MRLLLTVPCLAVLIVLAVVGAGCSGTTGVQAPPAATQAPRAQAPLTQAPQAQVPFNQAPQAQVPGTSFSDVIQPGNVFVYQMRSSFYQNGVPVGNAGATDGVHTIEITGVQGTSYSMIDTVESPQAPGQTQQTQMTYPGDGPRLYVSPTNPTGDLGPTDVFIGRGPYPGNPWYNGYGATNNALLFQSSVPDTGTTVNSVYDGQSGLLLEVGYDSPSEKFTMYLAQVG